MWTTKHDSECGVWEVTVSAFELLFVNSFMLMLEGSPECGVAWGSCGGFEVAAKYRSRSKNMELGTRVTLCISSWLHVTMGNKCCYRNISCHLRYACPEAALQQCTSDT